MPPLGLSEPIGRTRGTESHLPHRNARRRRGDGAVRLKVPLTSSTNFTTDKGDVGYLKILRASTGA